MAKKQKREKVPVSPRFVAAVVLFMASIFVIQTLFPENFGAFLRKEAAGVLEITVTVTGTEKDTTYATDTAGEIEALLTWADGKRMRHRTLADTMDFAGRTKREYSISLRRADGKYGGMVIDEDGFVQIGSGVYQVTGKAEDFLAELDALIRAW